MSHSIPTSGPLPQFTLRQLALAATLIDTALQTKGYLFDKVGQLDPAFDQGWVETVLRRALIGSAVDEGGLPVDVMQLGGREIILTEGQVQRCFRIRSARRDALGRLVVLASNDSLLSKPDVGIQGRLFGPPVASRTEQWVLAYIYDPAVQALKEIVAALPVGFANGRPGRLKLAHEVVIPVPVFEPPPFKGLDEDLELPGEDDLDERAG